MPFRLSEERRISFVAIDYLAAEFYTLEALSLLSASKLDPFRHSHERFAQDLHSYKCFFENRFSRMIFDYIVLASAGEARNARDTASRYLTHLQVGGYRSSIYENVYKYSPKSIAIACNELYSEETLWKEGYGGSKWGGISNAILLHEKLPVTAWIDHCIDLSHNANSCFTKLDYNIFATTSWYRPFLTMKTEAKTPEKLFKAVLAYELHVAFSPRIINLLERATALDVMEGYFLYSFLRIHIFFELTFTTAERNYKPLSTETYQ